MDTSKVVIAIDGPAGAGKSTVSKILSKSLGIRYLDTGAMYRAIAWKALRNGLTTDQGEAAAKLLDETDIDFGIGEPQPVFVDGTDVTAEIRTAEIGEAASAISQHTPVRQRMVERQKKLVAEGGVILEGRDVTTVVAPNATLKVYLTASLEERAKRRLGEFKEKGMDSSFIDVRTQILMRDHRDISREDSPLTVAPDACVVESAEHTPNEVAEIIADLLKKKLSG
ncbi:MAG: (d)CMP kinase [Armatimonadetes bacterium]|nr:(d)CMP kinase [Armatimonadota bacterium]